LFISIWFENDEPALISWRAALKTYGSSSARRTASSLFKGAKMLGFDGQYKTLVGALGVKGLPKCIT
jgi:hypothetical protein